jgi:transposase
MQPILDICCGLDVHKESVVACIIKTKTKTVLDRKQEDVEKEIRVFKTFLNDLIDLKNWVEANNCHHVAMESTGVYWYPVYDALETAFNGDIEILVTNARHMKNVPGKKTDIKDAEWIATLLRAGLLRGSFIPPVDIRELRQLTRYRKNIVEDINKQKNRIEKSLQQAGFKLSTFLSDVFGVSGTNLINVLITKGTITPSDVDKEVKRISPEKKAEIKFAINGKLTAHQRSLLKMQMSLLNELNKHLASVEDSIAAVSEKFEKQINCLDTIPGIAITSATAIIAEIGIDMSKFPTAEHFCSWAGLCPGDNQSAGKKKVPESPLETPILRD